MLRSEAVTQIQRRLGFRTDKATEALEELKHSQDRLEKRGIILPNGFTFWPWFLISEIATATASVNEHRVPFPAADVDGSGAFLAEWEEGGLWFFDSALDEDEQWQLLAKDDLDFLREEHPGTAEVPKAYAVDGKYFRLFPVPSESITCKLMYYASDAVLSATNDTENRWLKYAPWLLIGDAGARLALASRDTEARQDFLGDVARETTALYAVGEDRRHTNKRYVMGGLD